MRLSAAPAPRDRRSPAGFGARSLCLAAGLVGLVAPGASGQPMTTLPPDSLRLELVVPATARAGRPVPVTIRLSNLLDRPITVTLVGRDIAFDVVVTRDDGTGTVVWRRLADAAIQTILQLKTLGPRETLELKDAWRQRDNAGKPVPPGTYTLRGILPTDAPRPLETPVVRLEIKPE